MGPPGGSVRRRGHDWPVYSARLICSEEACGEAALAEAETLEELDALACDCGCGLEIIGWPDHVEDAIAVGDVLVVSFGRPDPSDLAA